MSAHNPFPKSAIRTLALDPIPAGDGKAKWRLLELTKSELESLSKWASANREGTDKRLLPTAILFGVLGVFANTQSFSAAIDQLLAWLFNSFLTANGQSLLSTVAQLIVVGIIFALASLFIYLLLLLFRNLVTQSLIIEACIVAEYVHEQSQCSGSTQATRNRTSFWEWLRTLLRVND